MVTASPRVGPCKQALAKGWALRQSPEKIVCQPFHAAAVKCESVVCAHKSKTKEVVRLFWCHITLKTNSPGFPKWSTDVGKHFRSGWNEILLWASVVENGLWEKKRKKDRPTTTISRYSVRQENKLSTRSRVWMERDFYTRHFRVTPLEMTIVCCVYSESALTPHFCAALVVMIMQMLNHQWHCIRRSRLNPVRPG